MTVERGALHSWGYAAEKLLRTMRLEAARSGHGDVLPAHLLLAVLDQPEVHQALRAIGQVPEVYGMRARVAAASLAPEEFSEETPLSRLTETLLAGIRPRRQDEDIGLLFLLALRQALLDQACRVLLRQGGVDTEVLDAALGRIA
jgi:hypothetical protein